MRNLLLSLTFLGCVLLSPSPVFAAATEVSRGQTTLTIEQNVVTLDNDVKYVGYVLGDKIQITLEYSARCNVVFNELALFKAIPFTPPRVVTGELANVSGTPRPGEAATAGSVTFDIKFNTLKSEPTGRQSGMARLNLVLGVDKDCNPATGDPDGVDRSNTTRVQIWVSTD